MYWDSKQNDNNNVTICRFLVLFMQDGKTQKIHADTTMHLKCTDGV